MLRSRNVENLSTVPLGRAALVFLLLCGAATWAQAQERPEEKPDVKSLILPPGDTEGLKLLEPESQVWLDQEKKRLVMAGRICLREGQLEMFACLAGTKEHESVVAVEAKAYVVHAALLACGAEAGKPVQFQPTFRPASGTEVAIDIYWRDKQGELQTAKAQDWVRDIRTQKEMTQNWVFAGSGFWTDDKTGQKFYLAEDGDFICVSNFASAMLDLPTESSQSAGSLLFEAFKDRIPEQGTPVTMVLTPKVEKNKDAAKKPVKKPVTKPAS
ncbi:MAG: YdjY domain-containing protein [Planctomycetia bacterium]|nr:YdjY domain-containing protein [Planctomycetia bacterium]